MRYLLHFLWKNYAFILFLILELISLVFVVNGNKHQSAVFSTFANKYGGAVFSSYSNMRNYFHLKDANNLLAQENARLKEQLKNIQFVSDSSNFESFEPIIVIDSNTIALADSTKAQFDFISAKVISNSINRQKNYIMLNKGTKHGIRENMGLIGPKGIVGVIFETSEDYSTAISLLNIKLSVSVKLKKNNELGTLIWDGQSELFGHLDAVENYVPVMIGDTIVTSGFSHIFPGGEYVGTVESVGEIPGKTLWNIVVKYNTDFSKLYWVNIARNINYEQQMVLKAVEIEN